MKSRRPRTSNLINPPQPEPGRPWSIIECIVRHNLLLVEQTSEEVIERALFLSESLLHGRLLSAEELWPPLADCLASCVYQVKLAKENVYVEFYIVTDEAVAPLDVRQYCFGIVSAKLLVLFQVLLSFMVHSTRFHRDITCRPEPFVVDFFHSIATLFRCIDSAQRDLDHLCPCFMNSLGGCLDINGIKAVL